MQQPFSPGSKEPGSPVKGTSLNTWTVHTQPWLKGWLQGPSVELTGVERAGPGPWSSDFTAVVFDSVFHPLLSGYNVNHLAQSSGCPCVCAYVALHSQLSPFHGSEAGWRCSGIYTFTLNCVTPEQADVLNSVLGKWARFKQGL